MAPPPVQSFLLLQGPISPFFRRLGAALEARGHRVLRVNLCLGDRLLWGRGGIDYRDTPDGFGAFVGALMDRERVTDLLLLGEQRPYHRAAREQARLRGVTVTVTDFGYLRPDWVTLERDGMNGLSHFPKDPEAVRVLASLCPAPDLSPRFRGSFFRQAATDLAYHLANAVPGFFPRYRSHLIAHPLLAHLTTGWRQLSGPRNRQLAQRLLADLQTAGEPYWLFPMQMELDYSIRAYSPFEGMVEPLNAVIGAFAKAAPEGRLVIKLHPLDPGLRSWRRIVARAAREAGVAGRVHFIDGGPLEALIAGARGVVTVNSTVGLMALQAGRPTMALGGCIYAMDGLTFQGPLEAFWTEACVPDPTLVDAFVRAATEVLHVRGGYYSEPGLTAAVSAAAERLETAAAEATAARIAHAQAVARLRRKPGSAAVALAS